MQLHEEWNAQGTLAPCALVIIRNVSANDQVSEGRNITFSWQSTQGCVSVRQVRRLILNVSVNESLKIGCLHAEIDVLEHHRLHGAVLEGLDEINRDHDRHDDLNLNRNQNHSQFLMEICFFFDY